MEGENLVSDEIIHNLYEATKNQLLSKSKSSQKGMERFRRRTKSRVANSVREFNSIDMNKLFKDNILSVNINVEGETNNYIVRISFGGFLDILHDELKKNNDVLDLKSIIKALIIGFNKDDVYINCSCPDFCLTADNKIKLLNGEAITVAEMLERFENGEKMYVYSADENGDFKPGKVDDVWISSMAEEILEVTLTNNKKISTTPNHRYLDSNGEYVCAKDLVVGQELFSDTPTNQKIVSIVKRHCHEPVYDLSVEKYNNFVVDAGVVLHNCYRFGYWTTRNKIDTFSLDGRRLRNPKLGVVDPQTIPSDITNPNDTLGSACKHVLLVLSNNSWIMKVASVINNYIKYMERHYQKTYAEIIYPAIYQKSYEEPVQLTIFDKNRRYAKTGKDTLDKANVHDDRDEKGRFTQGNKSGQKFTPKPQDVEDEEELTLFNSTDTI